MNRGAVRTIGGLRCGLWFGLAGLLLLAAQSPAFASADNAAAVGATPWTFEVDRQGGAAYRIPLTVPPGSGRMQPSLALVYSNHAGDGSLGVGWSLEGLSAIHRCAAIEPVHGYRRQIAMDDRDPLCIDGRFLVAVDGNEAMLASGELRTHMESFTRITRDGAGFVAEMKDGLRVVYGGSADARVSSADGSVLSWLMNRVVDRMGNAMDIDYVGLGNERHIKRIRYGAVTLSFQYEPRVDASVAYLAGVALPLTQRLARIVFRVGERLVKEYRLGYEESDDVFPDRLGSVTECAADGTCLRPSVFRWQPASPFDFSHWGDIAHAGRTLREHRLYRPGDFNGDGLTDLYEGHGAGEGYDTIWLNRGGGYFASVTGPRTRVERDADPANFHFADFNGDGLTDVYQFRYGDAYDALYLTGLSGEELRFETVDGIDSGIAASPTVARGCVHRDCLRFGDFNGDSRTDVYRIRHNGTRALPDEVHLSNGDGTYEIVPGIDSAADRNEGRAKKQVARIRTGDFDGDGIGDIYYIGDGGVGDGAQSCPRCISGRRNIGDGGIGGGVPGYVYLTAGDGRYRRVEAPANRFNSRRDGAEQLLRIRFGDFNGDGLTDVYYATPGGDATPEEVHLSRGDGSYTTMPAPGAAESPGREGLRASLLRVGFGDFNGDGRTDIYHMAAGTGQNRFYLAAGDGWRSYEGGDFVLAGSFSEQITTIGNTHLHDFNGDGATDVYRMEDPKEGTARIYVVHERGNRVRSLVDGLGAGVRIAYAPLRASSVHTPALDTEFRSVRRPPLLQVVAAVRRYAEGPQGVRHMHYRYGEARSDPAGFGFAGFGWKEMRNPGKRLVTRETYSQRFPYFGSVVERQIAAERERVVSASSTEYDELRPAHGKTVFPHVVRSVSRRYDLDGSLVSVVTVSFSEHDEYGNAGTVQTVTESDGHSFVRVERHEYRNDERSWILGLPTRTQLVESDGRHADIARVVEFDYEPQTGLLLSRSVSPHEPLAVVRRYEYDAFGNRVSEIAEAVHRAATPVVTHRVYDEYGRFPVKTVNAEGHVTTYVRDARFGQPLVIIDGNGLVTARRYDGWGRLVGESRPGGVQTTVVRTYRLPGDAPRGSVYMVARQTAGQAAQRMLHDAYGRVLSVRTVGFDGSPLFENRTYDRYGRVTGISLPSVSAEPVDWVEREYDELDRLVRESSPLVDGEYTERRFVYAGPVVEHVDELGRSKTIERDGLGRVVRIVEPAGGEMSFEYDPAGRMIGAVNAHGDEVTMEYDVFGNRLRVTYPDQGVQRFVYDPFGRVINAVSAAGSEQRMKYDRLGRLLERVGEEGTARWSYDVSGHGVGKLSSEEYGGHRRSFSYDAVGKISSIDDSRGYAIGIRYDRGRIEELHYPRGFTVGYSYNPGGYLSAVSSSFFRTGRLGGDSGFGEIPVDELSRIKLEEYVGHSAFYRRWASRLEAAGGEESLTKALGAAADKLERGMARLRREIAGGGSAPTTAYCEMSAPRGISRVAGFLKDARALDAALLARPSGGERAGRGMYARMVLSERILDATDECLAAMQSTAGGGYEAQDDIYYWRALAQDTVGRVVSERSGDGWRTQRRYHTGNGYLQEIKSDFGEFDGVRHLLYHYDEADNLLARTDAAQQVSEYFAYDDLDRLVTSIVVSDSDHDDYNKLDSYAYDALGNLVFKSGVGDYEYGSRRLPHAAIRIGGDNYEYDESGNLVHGSLLTAGWFSFGKPAFLEAGDGARLEFEYDANGDRLLKRSSSGDATSYFGKFYEKVLKADGSVEHLYYIHAGDRLVAVRRDRQADGRVSRELFYLHQDAVGSVDTVTDESGGVVDRLSYTPFGERRSGNWRSGSASSRGAIGRGFAGHEYLAEVDLVHMNGRIYDPRTARFLSPDPYVSLPLSTQSYNRYSYASNNPMKFTDPSGFFLKKIFKGIKRAIKGVVGFVKDNFQVIASIAAGYYIGAWAANSFIDSAVSKLVWSPGGMWSGTYMGAYNSALTGGAVLGGAVSGGVGSAVSGGGLRDMLVNTAAGGALRNIGVAAGGQWSAGRVAASAAVRGVAAELSGGRFQDAALSSLKWGGLRYAVGRMRRAMVAQSLLNPANATGQSAGLWGDGFKLGGGRYNALSDAPSPFGGRQGGTGELFGVAYAPDSLWDRIVEAYAGPHDYFNGFYWYDAQGNIDARLSPLQRHFGEAVNAANLVTATPFAAAALLPEHSF